MIRRAVFRRGSPQVWLATPCGMFRCQGDGLSRLIRASCPVDAAPWHGMIRRKGGGMIRFLSG